MYKKITLAASLILSVFNAAASDEINSQKTLAQVVQGKLDKISSEQQTHQALDELSGALGNLTSYLVARNENRENQLKSVFGRMNKTLEDKLGINDRHSQRSARILELKRDLKESHERIQNNISNTCDNLIKKVNNTLDRRTESLINKVSNAFDECRESIKIPICMEQQQNELRTLIELRTLVDNLDNDDFQLKPWPQSLSSSSSSSSSTLLLPAVPTDDPSWTKSMQQRLAALDKSNSSADVDHK